MAQKQTDTSFTFRVAQTIRRVPRGKVATYGQVAALVGSPRAAITVGQILHHHTETYQLPWQRIINSRGEISTTCLEHPAALQAELLRGDGIEVVEHRGNFLVDLNKYRWDESGEERGR